jgi:hypothetical protein
MTGYEKNKEEEFLTAKAHKAKKQEKYVIFLIFSSFLLRLIRRCG